MAIIGLFYHTALQLEQNQNWMFHFGHQHFLRFTIRWDNGFALRTVFVKSFKLRQPSQPSQLVWPNTFFCELMRAIFMPGQGRKMILRSTCLSVLKITILSGVITFFCSEAGYTVLCQIGWECNRQGWLEYYSSISVLTEHKRQWRVL